MPSGMEMAVSLAQFQNIPEPIDSASAGMLISSRLLHPLNASFPNVRIVSGNTTFFSDELPMKAW